jgi:hypothetical protein
MKLGRNLLAPTCALLWLAASPASATAPGSTEARGLAEATYVCPVDETAACELGGSGSRSEIVCPAPNPDVLCQLAHVGPALAATVTLTSDMPVNPDPAVVQGNIAVAVTVACVRGFDKYSEVFADPVFVSSWNRPRSGEDEIFNVGFVQGILVEGPDGNFAEIAARITALAEGCSGADLSNTVPVVIKGRPLPFGQRNESQTPLASVARWLMLIRFSPAN